MICCVSLLVCHVRFCVFVRAAGFVALHEVRDFRPRLNGILFGAV